MKNRLRCCEFAGLALLLSWLPCAHSADLKVVVSIKPIHALVAGVMQGVAEPVVLVYGAGSPHAYSLKPSQARLVEQADVIFWVGRELETFLEKPLEARVSKAAVVELLDTLGLHLLQFREAGLFADNEAHSTAHEHDGIDSHVWLDPDHAKTLVRRIAQVLIRHDADHAAQYAHNAQVLMTRLDELDATIGRELQGLQEIPFIAFHDAWHYFEKRYGLRSVGAITISPEVQPGAERITTIQARLHELDIACVFTEPQFRPRIVDMKSFCQTSLCLCWIVSLKM